ncbi:beta-hexosaminidase, partial [Streptococcus suis]
EGRRQEIMLPKEEALAVIGRDEAKQLAKEVADKAITLVKAKHEGIFPVNPERYKRIVLVEGDGEKGGCGAMIHAGTQ